MTIEKYRDEKGNDWIAFSRDEGWHESGMIPIKGITGIRESVCVDEKLHLFIDYIKDIHEHTPCSHTSWSSRAFEISSEMSLFKDRVYDILKLDLIRLVNAKKEKLDKLPMEK